MRANEAPRQCIQWVLSDEQGTETETISTDWVTEGDVPYLHLILLTEAVSDEKRVTASWEEIRKVRERERERAPPSSPLLKQ